MKKLLYVGFTLLLAAQAQTTPQTTELWQKFRQAHLTSVLTLESAQELAILRYLGPGGQVALELQVNSLVAFKSNTLRIEYQNAGQNVQIVQVAEQAQSWTPQSGTVRMPASLANELRQGLNRGWYLLRHLQPESVQVLGPQTWMGVSGIALEYQMQQSRGVLLLSPEGRLLAERYDSTQLGQVTSLYQGYEQRAGLWLPTKAVLYAGETPFATSETLDLKINPTFAAERWSMPR